MTALIRKPFLIWSLVLFAAALAIEAGSRIWIDPRVVDTANVPTPGLGIPSLAALDLLVVLTVIITMLIGLQVPGVGRITGIASVIVSFFGCLGSLILLFITIGMLLLMIGLLLAVPFGTAVYMAVYGSFPLGTAGATLAVIVVLKLAGFFCLVLGSEQILKSCLLLLLFACSIGLTVLLSFLHGFPPGVLASITDAIGAIVAFIVAIIWAIIYFVVGIISVIKNLKLKQAAGVIPQ
jgi:hypothetical protein